jgi:Zn-dependent M28 family amino/carboxypeptidase
MWFRKDHAASFPNDLLIDRLHTHVDRLAGLIGPRYPGRPKSFGAAADYVEREFGQLGDAVIREHYRIDDQEIANIYIERPGQAKPGEIIIVGAHYDTVPGTPGADDNASAVAMLIEIARLLHPHPSPRTVRFVAFACEEWPYFQMEGMGSQVHARNCRGRQERVKAMICLEMVGYYVDAPGSQRLPEGIPRWLHWAFPKRGNFIAAVGNMPSASLVWRFRRGFKAVSSFPLFSIALPERIGDIRLSDNSSFWDQGYPALMITDTSFLRNPHYHCSTDTVETLDYRRMAQATIGVAGGVARFAGCKRRISI